MMRAKILKTSLVGMLMVSLVTAQTSPSPAPAAADPFFKAYDAALSDPETMLPMVRELAGPAARIVYVRETGRLLVYGAAAAHEVVAAAAREMSAPVNNVRIEVFFDGQESG